MGSGPSRLNWFTVLLALLLAAGAYGVWKFLPHYYSAWMVDHALADAAAQCYKIANYGAGQESKLRTLEAETKTKLVNTVGITDPDLVVNIRVEAKKAYASAIYRVVVVHPKINKQTVLKFNRRAVTDVSRVEW